MFWCCGGQKYGKYGQVSDHFEIFIISDRCPDRFFSHLPGTCFICQTKAGVKHTPLACAQPASIVQPLLDAHHQYTDAVVIIDWRSEASAQLLHAFLPSSCMHGRKNNILHDSKNNTKSVRQTKKKNAHETVAWALSPPGVRPHSCWERAFLNVDSRAWPFNWLPVVSCGTREAHSTHNENWRLGAVAMWAVSNLSNVSTPYVNGLEVYSCTGSCNSSIQGMDTMLETYQKV